jgi:E3 ubiquitin-protein ligase DOA10
MKWIHEGCLDRWRNESANPRSEVCHYRYQWRRELYSRWLLHWTTTGTISLILIVGSVVVVAFTLKYTALLPFRFCPHDTAGLVGGAGDWLLDHGMPHVLRG